MDLDETEMVVGTLVRIDGMVKFPERNGRLGRISSVGHGRRFDVSVLREEQEGMLKQVSSRYLKPLDQPCADASRTFVRVEVLNLWEQMLQDEDSMDVKLIGVDGAVVMAHRAVLSQASEVFRRMLSSSMLEGQKQEIKVMDFSSDQLNFILGLIYTGQVDSTPSIDLLISTTTFFKRFLVQGFLPWMVDSLKQHVTEETFGQILQFAIKEDIGPLRWFCVKFADDAPEVQRRFQKEDYAPEVIFELQAIWPAPVPRKRGSKRKVL